MQVNNSSLCVSVFTADQYQQHQEQLALMQKQQLDQIQANDALSNQVSTRDAHVSRVVKSGGLRNALLFSVSGVQDVGLGQRPVCRLCPHDL